MTRPDDPTPNDWEFIESYISPSLTSLPNWDAVWARLQQRIGPTQGDFVQMLDRNANLIATGAPDDNEDLMNLVDLEARRAAADIGASITGVARAADLGLNLAGQTVTARNLSLGETFVTQSLADGSFIFDQLSAGSYQLSFQNAMVVSSGDVTVADGQPLTGVSLTLSAGASLSGRVLAQENTTPIDNAEIIAIGSSGAQFTAFSDATGAYLLAGLPANTYTLTISADGRARTTVNDVQLTSGATTSDLTIAPESAIDGAISLSLGGPPAGNLTVIANPSGNTDLAQEFISQTNGVANFRLGDLPAGTYDVTIEMDGYVAQTISGVVVGAATEVKLAAISLAPAAVVSGTLVSNDAQILVAGTQIGAFNDATLVARTNADSSGAFSLAGLAAGTYTIAPVAANGYLFSPVTVTVSAGQTLGNIALEIDPGGTISGNVADSATAGALAGFPVYLIDSSGDAQAASTDATGAYKFSGLSEGTYTVTVGQGFTAAGVSQTVQVTSLSGTFNANLQVAAQARLQGTLLTAAGTPVAGGDIAIYDSGTGTLLGTATSAADGSFSFLVALPAATSKSCLLWKPRNSSTT